MRRTTTMTRRSLRIARSCLQERLRSFSTPAKAAAKSPIGSDKASFATVDFEAHLPEGFGGELGKVQENFYNGGGNVIIERDTTMRLLETMDRCYSSKEAVVMEEDDADEDWTCEQCGFCNFASKSRRMYCAKCVKARQKLPQRPFYIFTGERGTGKSVALGHVVSHARANNWIGLYINAGWDVMNKGQYVVDSKHHEGMFEEPGQSVKILQQIMAAHSDKLDKVAINNEEVCERWGLKSKSATIEKMLTEALRDDRKDESSTAVADLQACLADCTEYPVVVAVDEFSSWYAPLSPMYLHGNAIMPHKIVHIAALRPLNDKQGCAAHTGEENPLPQKFKRGLSVFADSASRFNKLWKPWHETHNILHYELKMTPYTHAEFAACVQHYCTVELTGHELDKAQIDSIRMATQANPGLTFGRFADLG